LDLFSFDTMIPKHLLEDYTNLLFKHKYLAITSANKLGKTYLMRKLAQFLSKQLATYLNLHTFITEINYLFIIAIIIMLR
jgi:hypothetical protein